MKKFIVSVMLLLPLGMVAQEIKIAVVNTGEIFNSMPEVEAMGKEVEAMTKQYEDYLLGLNEEYTKKMNELSTQGESLTENIRMLKVQEIQELQGRIESYYEYANQERTRKQEELFAPIQEKLFKAINEVGEENGYTYILNPQALLYTGSTAVDATDLVKAKLGLN